jgi:uncharacterized protein YneF (UPF0154 family)
MTALYILLALLVGVILGGTLTHVAIAWKITEQNKKKQADSGFNNKGLRQYYKRFKS